MKHLFILPVSGLVGIFLFCAGCDGNNEKAKTETSKRNEEKPLPAKTEATPAAEEPEKRLFTDEVLQTEFDKSLDRENVDWKILIQRARQKLKKSGIEQASKAHEKALAAKDKFIEMEWDKRRAAGYRKYGAEFSSLTEEQVKHFEKDEVAVKSYDQHKRLEDKLNEAKDRLKQAHGWDISFVTAESVTEREITLAQNIARADGSYIAEDSRRAVESISEKLVRHRKTLTLLASDNASDRLSTRIGIIQGEMSKLEFQKNNHLGVIANFRADSKTITERNVLEAARKQILEKTRALAGIQEKFDSGAFDKSPEEFEKANREADALEKDIATLKTEEKIAAEAYDKARSSAEETINKDIGYIDLVRVEKEQREKDAKAAAQAKVEEEKKKEENATFTRRDQKGRVVVMDKAGMQRYQRDMARAKNKGNYANWIATVDMQQYAMKTAKVQEQPAVIAAGIEETSPERYYFRGVVMGENGWNKYLADCERAQKLGQYDDFIRKTNMKEYGIKEIQPSN